MAPPDGHDALTVRQRYLRRRHARRSEDRGVIALWVGLAALFAWLFIAGFAGLAH